METIETQILKRFKNQKDKNLNVSDAKENIAPVLKIGYNRFMQMVGLIERVEQTRVLSIADILMINNVEQQIRSFLSERISEFEIELRSVLSEYYLMWYGIHGYHNDQSFSDQETHEYLMYKIRKQLKMQSEYEVVDLLLVGDLKEVPICLALDISTFQMLTIFFKLLTDKQKTVIAAYFQTDKEKFTTWIEFVLVVRNAVAHQGLLFNREFKRNAILPEKYKRTVYAVNYVLNEMLKLPFDEQNTIKKYFNDGDKQWVAKYYGIY